ncbi:MULTISPECIES: ABC transporter ATP-binding protein [Pseudothermotoga]|jgi:iron complex transport system ATP-binding protein|uniref:ABC transporter related n=1 Tax=Pseudothermotoga lettingae (strain ATCC BAA-301 / DSM 14385 / NBRC 107922 / TMO) TaxID=416591 RepID=A8F6M4_PSELT|nr:MULTISPECIES: ABC transporter ATP-binding protein [Pseudothermotoga]ABV33808.1 ABC transporter related [Pseudothermotoga lettingae TMO]KUK21374.1 MAG: ABC transporter related [Pseudothermotoga lettingae]MDI3495412.1 heme transport system ATP-binding protein [Pseudothermotoga sp.]MDK2884366.1 heme transport system ATP-binding protein [Pseudothermotoga sp.]GLI49258.1 ABC transporter ATP-binding protein [Pseudothermotoga lettingae TMO]
MIQLSNLSFAYNGKPFINQIELLIEKAKITSIIGPNGSGKSTLLNLIAGLYKPHTGNVVIEGSDIFKISRKEIAKKLAIVFQQNYAPEDITVKELVQFGRNPHKKYFELLNDDDAGVVDWALRVTNMNHLSDRYVSQLSGGERQRAWIAMGLVQSTGILLLDEPTTFLDIRYQIEILELIKKINADCKLTVVMVLHDLNQAIRYSHRIIVMNSGEIVAKGDPGEIITPELIREVYGVEAEKIFIRHSGDKIIQLLFKRAFREER